MSTRRFFAAVGFAALLAGSAAWWLTRPATGTRIPALPAGVLWSAPFRDTVGAPHALGEFQGKVVVANFWATWCAPCREEMPMLSRLQERWKDRGVTFVGLSEEDADTVARFARPLGLRYPLWMGEAAGELSRRLGNSASVLPHTVVLDGEGRARAAKVGPYTEGELDRILGEIVAKRR